MLKIFALIFHLLYYCGIWTWNIEITESGMKRWLMGVHLCLDHCVCFEGYLQSLSCRDLHMIQAWLLSFDHINVRGHSEDFRKVLQLAFHFEEATTKGRQNCSAKGEKKIFEETWKNILKKLKRKSNLRGIQYTGFVPGKCRKNSELLINYITKLT